MALPLRIAARAFQGMLIYLGVIFVTTLLFLNLLVVFAIVRPVRRLSTMADQISMGNLEVPELPVRGRDEIAVLAGSFNRMRRSLVQAMKMLGE